MSGYITPALGTAAAGAAIKYLFARPSMDRAGFQLLGVAGLTAAGIQVISQVFSKFITNFATDRDSKNYAFVASRLFSTAALTYIAKGYLNWSKTEAVVMGLVSTALFANLKQK